MELPFLSLGSLPSPDRIEELEEVFRLLPDKIVWIPEFVSISGSSVYGKGQPNDVDLVLRAEEVTDGRLVLRLELDSALALKLRRALGRLLRRPVHIVGSTYGPNWTYLPVYDLALVLRPKFQIRVVDEPEFGELCYRDAEYIKEAEASKKEDKIKPLRRIYPLKPLRAVGPRQRQTIEALIAALKDEDFPLFVSKKYDGARHVFARDGDKVLIYSDDGTIVDGLERFEERLRKLPVKSVVLDVEIEYWKDGQHFPREVAAGALHARKDLEHLVANVFDILYLDGEDLHKRPFAERWRILQTLELDSETIDVPKPGTVLNRVPHYLAEDKEECRELVEKLSTVPGSEGVVVKRADGPYPLTGQPGATRCWIKYHKACWLNVVALERVKTKGGAYLYWYGIDPGGYRPARVRELGGRQYMLVGKTFASTEKMEPGEVFELEAETVNLTRYADGTVAVTCWVPNVIEPKEAEVDDVDTVMKKAKRAGVFQEKRVDEEGEVEYLPTLKIADWRKYDPAAVRDDQLQDDFRIIAAKYATMERGGKTEFPTLEDVLSLAGRIVEEIYRRGKVTFHPEGWQPATRRMMEKVLRRLVKRGLVLVEPHGELLWKGKKRAVVKAKRMDLSKPHWVISDLHRADNVLSGLAYGVLRLEDPIGIDLEEFERRKDEHLVSQEERERWWPGKDRLYLYPVRDFIPLEEPLQIEVPVGTQVVVSEVKFKEENFPLDPSQVVAVSLLGLEFRQADPYLYYPPEDRRWRYVAQRHWRGKSFHTDLRFEQEDILVGWTLSDAIAGVVTEVVDSLAKARKWHKRDISKIDWEKGEIKKRRIRSGVIRRASILCHEKKVEPKAWLTFEGVQPPGKPGSTKQYPGVFHIIDEGRVEYLAQKPWFHEYWLSEGRLRKGRWVFRLLGTEQVKELSLSELEELIMLTKAGRVLVCGNVLDTDALLSLLQREKARRTDILPPGTPEEEARTPYFWLMIQPEDPYSVYVLSEEALEKDWLPPEGKSALPQEIRERIPRRLQFWRMKGKERAEARKELVEHPELWHPGFKQKQRKRRFVLQRHWFRGQIVIRFGPSEEHWDLRISDDEIWHLVLKDNPLKGPVVGYEKPCSKDAVFITTEGKRVPVMELDRRISLKPGTDANPTKATPAYIEPVDGGTCIVLDESEGWKKIEFRGKKLKGVYTFRKEPEMPFWQMERSEVPGE